MHIQTLRGSCSQPDAVTETTDSTIDPEDGITEAIERILSDRTKEKQVKEWPSLWKLLFPDDHEALSPGNAPVRQV